MMYLIATTSILAAVVIQIAWYATRKEELVKMQWDQKSWDRLQKEMDYNLARMWKLAGGRPKQ